MTLISVKSKYGSCSRNCTGLIKFNNISKKKYIFTQYKYAKQITMVDTESLT